VTLLDGGPWAPGRECVTSVSGGRATVDSPQGWQPAPRCLRRWIAIRSLRCVRSAGARTRGRNGVRMGSRNPRPARYNGVMQSPQSLVLCSDFVESEQTRVDAQIRQGSLVMKGSPVRIRASASRRTPAKAPLRPSPPSLPIRRCGPFAGHGAFPSRPLRGHEGSRRPPDRPAPRPDRQPARVLSPRHRAASFPRAPTARTPE
jgi:hypothetical protein